MQLTEANPDLALLKCLSLRLRSMDYLLPRNLRLRFQKPVFSSISDVRWVYSPEFIRKSVWFRTSAFLSATAFVQSSGGINLGTLHFVQSTAIASKIPFREA